MFTNQLKTEWEALKPDSNESLMSCSTEIIARSCHKLNNNYMYHNTRVAQYELKKKCKNCKIFY